MTTSTHLHRSTAYVKAITERGRTWKPDPITSQFRFIVRMAYACHQKQVPYDLAWSVQDRTMQGDNYRNWCDTHAQGATETAESEARSRLEAFHLGRGIPS